MRDAACLPRTRPAILVRHERSETGVTKLDVAILGGGLAANLLARQLHIQQPDLSVGIFERSTETHFKVGESSVEIAGDYLIRKLKLSTHLYLRHLPKNGLRFFFDDPQRSSRLEDMSEIGPISLPFRPAFQLDRAALERELLEANEAAGVRIERGVRARNLELAMGDGPHHFDAVGADGTKRVEARWVVDATGRASLIAKKLDLRLPEEGHRIAAAWGRFEDVVDIDAYGDDAFRRRVNFTCRRLSTVHFNYPGYWIWFIPLRSGVTSVGVVCEREIWDREIGSVSALRPFLDSHRAVRDLLEGSKQLDEGGFQQLAFGSRQLFSADRWATIGEAGVFSDPFYSPGSDFIAIENDMVADLIERDHAPEPDPDWSERVALYDEFVRFRHESTLRIHRGLYSMLGSFELFKLRYSVDLAAYYNLWMYAYMRDHHLNFFWLRKQLRQKDVILDAQANFADLFRKLEAELSAGDAYFRGNHGEFATGLEDMGFMRELEVPRSSPAILKRTEAIFNTARGRALDLLGEPADSARREHFDLLRFSGEEPII